MAVCLFACLSVVAGRGANDCKIKNEGEEEVRGEQGSVRKQERKKKESFKQLTLVVSGI